MNTKKIILNTLCVLAVTVAAQYAYAQSPSMEAKFVGEAWGSTFTTGAKKKASKPAATAETAQKQTPAETNASYANAGPEMKFVNGAEYNARIAGEICECIGDACKCAWEGIKNFFTEAAKNTPAGFVPGREGAIMRSGENFWKNIKSNKKTTAKSDSLAASLERAGAEAALKHAASQK